MTTTEFAVDDTDTRTDIVPAEAPPADEDAAPSPPQPELPQVEFLWVNPRDLIIGPNVRTDVELPKQRIADIRDRGVREPIPCRRNAEGDLVVRKGQIRTLCAIEADQTHVPVLVEPDTITDDQEREIDRIIDQLGENEHRSPISEADEVRATQALLDLGLRAGQIARRRHIAPKRVKAAVEVASSPAAFTALTGGVTNLEQAAVLAEFGDDEEAVARLTEAAARRPEQFDHIAQQLRDAREEARLREELTAQLAEQGIAVIDAPDTLQLGPTRPLSQLRPTPRTKSGRELTVAKHATCPGHAAYIEERHWRPVADRLNVVYVCTDFVAHGHAERYADTGEVSTRSTTGPAAGPMTEDQKAERREVITNNKAWRSAEEVRRTWLKNFLARKSAPKDGVLWVAKMLTAGSYNLRRAMEQDHDLAAELLGLAKPEHGYYRPLVSDALDKASSARATTIAVALVVGALERGTSVDTWRNPDSEARAYFRQLGRWGYDLSEVEQLVVQEEENPDVPAHGASPEEETDTPAGDEPDPAEPSEEPATDEPKPNADDAEPDGNVAADDSSTVAA